jgi:hypothetical protein
MKTGDRDDVVSVGDAVPTICQARGVKRLFAGAGTTTVSTLRALNDTTRTPHSVPAITKSENVDSSLLKTPFLLHSISIRRMLAMLGRSLGMS